MGAAGENQMSVFKFRPVLYGYLIFLSCSPYKWNELIFGLVVDWVLAWGAWGANGVLASF